MADRPTQAIVTEAVRRADWCETWWKRVNIQRPQITTEWLGLLEDVRSLAARLTTAETERDELRVQRDAAQAEIRSWQALAGDGVEAGYDWKLLARAAEARVEALSAALRDILDLLPSGEYSHAVAYIARAALACPPQQRGEK